MNIESGILIALIAGALNGMFALPMKLNKNWAWENNWFPFSFLSLMIFPFVIVVLSIPKPVELLISLPIHNIIIGLLCGIIIYGGSLLFGISLGYIGIALSFTLLVGSMSIVGVLLPLIIFNSNVLFSIGGTFILSGVLLFIISLFFSFKAGQLREASLKTRDIENTREKSSMQKGMILAITGGLLSGLLSLVMNMGWAKEIVTKAVQAGNAKLSYASNAVLFIILIGGMIPNIGYCIFLLNKNNKWSLYKRYNSILSWIAILSMGLIYSASNGLWGISISESMLGNLGPSVGWALFIGMMVISSNISGYLTGEWKSAGNKSLKYLFVSIGLIISALLLIGYGNYTLY
ncbi:MAG: L-rhamnose/proton symporter RhaT [Bacteroidales bacterium]